MPRVGWGFLAILATLPCNAGVEDDLVQAAKSPYELARFIDAHPDFNTWDPLWKVLGIRHDDVLLPYCDRGERACAEELITVLDPFQVILLLRGGGVSGYSGEVYLRYRRADGLEGTGPWSFAGFYSSPGRQYDQRHEIVRIGPKPYLVVTAGEHYGSIPDATSQRWFDLTAEGLDPVLRFNLKSEDDAGIPDGVIITSGAFVLSFEPAPAERITVSYQLVFHAAVYRSESLGGVEANVTYIRRKQGFEVESVEPDTPQDQARVRLFDAWLRHEGPSSDDYLTALLPRLRQIAAGQDTDQREWLRQFLTNCKNNPEKRELQELLTK